MKNRFRDADGELRRAPWRPTGRATNSAGILLLVVLGVAASTAPSPGQGPTSQAASGIDLETANDLVREYMHDAISKLPRDWREAERKRLNEAELLLDAERIAQFNGPAGHLAFEYDAKNGSLLCESLIHNFRRDFTRFGLGREEIVEALEAHAARGASLGGGEIAYDPVVNSVFLRLEYREPPESARRMTKEIDRLVAAASAWREEHYLDAIRERVAGLAPPEEATAQEGGFEVTMVLTDDPRYIDEWHKPPGSLLPDVVTRSELARGEQFVVVLLFSGATLDASGRCRVEGKVSVDYPNGEPAAWNLRAAAWDSEVAPPPGHVQIGASNVTLVLDSRQPLGEYLVRAEVCDQGSQRCVQVAHPFELLAAPE